MTQEQRIIQKTEKDICYISSNGSRAWGKSFRGGFETAVRFTLENLWISVGDELPARDKDDERFSVNILFRNRERVEYGYYCFLSNKWRSYSGYNVDPVQYWMPIPPLPKGGEE